MLESGQIDAEEAATLLAALDEPSAQGPVEVAAPALAPEEHQMNLWARFWIYPMLAGGAVLILGALVIGLVYASDVAWGWSICGWLPLLLGLGIVLLAIWTRRATWMHLRISEEGRQKIAFSFPLPLGLAAWAVRILQPFVPQLQETGVDDLIIALRDSAGQGEPLFIDVQDEEDGERVQIYIG